MRNFSYYTESILSSEVSHLKFGVRDVSSENSVPTRVILFSLVSFRTSAPCTIRLPRVYITRHNRVRGTAPC